MNKPKFCMRCFREVINRSPQAKFCMNCVIFKDERRKKCHNKWQNIKQKRERLERAIKKALEQKYYDKHIRGED